MSKKETKKVPVDKAGWDYLDESSLSTDSLGGFDMLYDAGVKPEQVKDAKQRAGYIKYLEENGYADKV